jgi:hypothetical protein
VFTDADLIHSYTRAEALSDGQLVDLTEQARRAGFRIPVACTAAVFGECIEVPSRRRHIESVDARAHDVLFVLFMLIRRSGGNRSRLDYQIRCSTKEGRRLVRLKALCGPGDDAKPVITIMKPEED